MLTKGTNLVLNYTMIKSGYLRTSSKFTGHQPSCWKKDFLAMVGNHSFSDYFPSRYYLTVMNENKTIYLQTTGLDSSFRKP